MAIRNGKGTLGRKERRRAWGGMDGIAEWMEEWDVPAADGMWWPGWQGESGLERARQGVMSWNLLQSEELMGDPYATADTIEQRRLRSTSARSYVRMFNVDLQR